MVSSSNTPIRVLIVEDSTVCRELLISIFQTSPDFEVVGVARNGLEGLRLAKRIMPDVITMDVFMPHMDGYQATQQIMEQYPCPIVMVTNRLHRGANQLTFNALQAGALSIIHKPTVNDPPASFQQLLQQVRLMAELRVVRRRPLSTRSPATVEAARQSGMPALKADRSHPQLSVKVVVMAASTGGPTALAHILGDLPADFPVPIFVVQHITAGFETGFVKWLNTKTNLTVRSAEAKQWPRAGEVWLAPDGHYLVVDQQGYLILKKRVIGPGPGQAADHLFTAVAQVYGRQAIGVILTGMGRDGAAGLHAMHQTGAYTIAQNEESSVIFGMPAAAIQLGAASQVQPLTNIAGTIMDLLWE
jgi:two-component system, chemotaxis family, protein-glutamate methylesterase/glutaminase